MALQEDEVLAKAAVKFRVEMFCLAWGNTDFGKICIQLLYFLLITGLSLLYDLAVEGGCLMYLPSGKLVAWKSCSDISKASLITELSGSIEEGPQDLSS